MTKSLIDKIRDTPQILYIHIENNISFFNVNVDNTSGISFHGIADKLDDLVYIKHIF